MFWDALILAGKLVAIPGTLCLFVPVYKTIKIQSVISQRSAAISSTESRDLVAKMIEHALVLSVQMTLWDRRLALIGVSLLVVGLSAESLGLAATLMSAGKA